MIDQEKLERMARRGFKYFDDPENSMFGFDRFKKEVLEQRSSFLLEALTATESTEDLTKIKKILVMFDGIVTR